MKNLRQLDSCLWAIRAARPASQSGRARWFGLLVHTGQRLESTRAVIVGNVMLGLDTEPGCALEHITDAKFQLCVLGVTDSHDEASHLSIRLTFYKEVEPKVMVGAIVHFVAPDPSGPASRCGLVMIYPSLLSSSPFPRL